MATINLPPVEPKGNKSQEDYLIYIANLLAMISDDLQNIFEGRIDFKNIKAEGIVTKNLAAGSVVADKIDVDKLSAISADLGKVVAGILIGAYISTADGTYPRIDFSSAENLLKAMYSADSYISILPNVAGSPALMFKNGTFETLLFVAGNTLVLNTISTSDVQFTAKGNVFLSAGTGFKVRFDSWDAIRSTFEGKTLKQELDDIKSRLRDLENPPPP